MIQEMGMHLHTNYHKNHLLIRSISSSPTPSCSFFSSSSILQFQKTKNGKSKPNRALQGSSFFDCEEKRRTGGGGAVGRIVVASSNVGGGAPAAVWWDGWKPVKAPGAPLLSDVIWPAAGAFAAMAALGKVDQILVPRGVSMTIAPLGAVCAVLFTAPSSPAARKYNMFMAQIGCAAIGVLAFTIFGPGWLARSSGLAAAIAFMIYTRSVHPPAASLPLLFIDGAKLHQLNFWYALFPGAAGCILLCFIQEVVCYLKDNFKF